MQPHTYPILRAVEEEHWWFAARRTIVMECVGAALRGTGRPAPRILDVGCGTGANLVALRNWGHTAGLDVFGPALRYCQQRGCPSVIQGDAQRLPLADGSFDLVLALDLLEHLADDRGGAKELARVLAKGGHLVVWVPAFRFLWGVQDEVSNHYRRYTASELSAVLRAAGLQIDRITYANAFLFPVIWLGRVLVAVYRGVTGRSIETENRLHPKWSNAVLRRLFELERHVPRSWTLPIGVSLLCEASRHATPVLYGTSPDDTVSQMR